MDKVEQELQELAEGLDIEKAAAQREWESDDNKEDDEDGGWVEVRLTFPPLIMRSLIEVSGLSGCCLLKPSVKCMYNNSPVPIALQDFVCNHPFKHNFIANVVHDAEEAKIGCCEDVLQC